MSIYSTSVKVIFLFLLVFLFTSTITASDLYSDWNSQIPLPFSSSGNQTLILNNSIYSFGGGDNFTYRQDINSSKIQTDGNLSLWSLKGQLPLPITWYSVVNQDNNIYLIGGATPAPTIPTVSSVDTVYHTSIDSLGNIMNWTQQPSLPQKLARGGAYIYNNRIYYIGGLVHNQNGNESAVSSVYMSNINQDRTLSSWSSINSLPQARAEFAIFYYQNKLYIAGGMQSNGQPASSIYKGEIDEFTGNIIWNLDSSLPKGLRRPAYTQRGKSLYLIGGYDGSTFTSTTYSSQLNQTNSIGLWETLPLILPVGSCCNASIATNQDIYLLGGHDGLFYYPNVYRSHITSTKDILNFKQYDPEWKDREYDTARVWSPSKFTIERWGCALTSAAMVLSYHGHTITPDTLNSYLINHNGYTRNGGIIWGKISKYTKDHETETLPALEFNKSQFSFEELEHNIQKLAPSIIQIRNSQTDASHFVVATSIKDGNFIINDPATTQNLLSDYPQNSYLTSNTFIPSHTDLSSINIYINSNMNMKVKGPNGQIFTSGFFSELSLEDEIEHVKASTENLKNFFLAKPTEGNYVVEVTGGSAYKLDTYIFNRTGDSVDNSFAGNLSSHPTDIYIIDIKSNGNNVQKISFQFIFELLDNDFKTGLIKNKTIYKSLRSITENAQKQYINKKTNVAKGLIAVAISEIKSSSKLIDKEAIKILLDNMNLLLKVL